MTLCQRIRKKGKDQKGFTLGELLIVVAIIGVLVAISIPIFTKQIRKAQIATIVANSRSFYSVLLTECIECETYGYSWEPYFPLEHKNGKTSFYFKDHNGNEQRFPLPGFYKKLEYEGVHITWGMSTLEGKDYNFSHTNDVLRYCDGYYPYIIVAADGKVYSFGVVSDWRKETIGKEEPEEVGFEFDE